MTKTIETLPDPSAIRFLEAELDGTYTDYHFIEREIAWQLTHDLDDNTWTALLDNEDATSAQVTALYWCLTDEQRADAEDEFRELSTPSKDYDDTDETPAMSM